MIDIKEIFNKLDPCLNQKDYDKGIDYFIKLLENHEIDIRTSFKFTRKCFNLKKFERAYILFSAISKYATSVEVKN